MSVLTKHQRRVARMTLRTPMEALAAIGGMGYADAYRVLFRYSGTLADRCRELVARYGAGQDVAWELAAYGWTPAAMLAALEAQS